jgi:hypothetical protein
MKGITIMVELERGGYKRWRMSEIALSKCSSNSSLMACCLNSSYIQLEKNQGSEGK